MLRRDIAGTCKKNSSRNHINVKQKYHSRHISLNKIMRKSIIYFFLKKRGFTAMVSPK